MNIIVMILLGIIQLSLISAITVIEFKKKSPAVFMWGTLLLMFGLMHMINTFSGDYQYSDEVLNEASVFVIGYCCVYIFTRFIILRNRNCIEEMFEISNLRAKMKNEYEYGSGFFFIWVIFILLKIIPFLKYAGGVLSTSWGTGRNYADSLAYMNTEQLSRVFVYAFSGLCLLFRIKEDNRWILMSLIILFDVLLTRNRIEILPLLCSLMGLYIIKTNKIGFKTVVAGIIGAFIVIYIVYALRVFRHYGTINDFIQNFNLEEFNKKIRICLASDDGELGLRRDFYYFIKGNNNFTNFGKLHSYIRLLLVYIPTKLSLGLKPDDFAISMGQAVGMSAGGSTHPTLFGDCYANMGIFGIFLGGFWALYANIVDGLIYKRKFVSIQIFVYVLNAVVYCIIARGSVYNGFWYVAYGIPVLLFFDWSLANIRIPKIKFVFNAR